MKTTIYVYTNNAGKKKFAVKTEEGSVFSYRGDYSLTERKLRAKIIRTREECVRRARKASVLERVADEFGADVDILH